MEIVLHTDIFCEIIMKQHDLKVQAEGSSELVYVYIRLHGVTFHKTMKTPNTI
jgi:hypothetical protein